MLACPYFKKLNKAIGRKYQEWDTDIVLREFRGQMNFTGIIRKDMCSRQKVNLLSNLPLVNQSLIRSFTKADGDDFSIRVGV